MTGVPTISAIMPCHNSESTVERAIASVLEQTFPDFELLVVDDGSIDRTPDVIAGIRDPRVKTIRLEKNVGAGAARNVGLEMAQGTYIAICDADDIALPTRFETTICLARSEGAAVASGQIAHFGPWGGPIQIQHFPLTHSSIRQRLDAGHMGIAHPAAIFRRDVLERLTGWDPRCRRAQDLELCRRVQGRFAASDEILVHYRTADAFPAWEHWLDNAFWRLYAVRVSSQKVEGLQADAPEEVARDIRTRGRLGLERLLWLRSWILYRLGGRIR